MEPISLPEPAWRHREVRDAATGRDVQALLRLAQAYTGASQDRLGRAVGMTQARINELLSGQRTVASLEVYKRIAAGLSMPDDVRMLLGLAPLAPHAPFALAALGEVDAIYPSQAHAAAEIRRAAAETDELDVVAVRGLGILGLNDGLLRGPLTAPRENRLRLRVLILDPSCPAAAVRAAQIGESPTAFRRAAELSIERLGELTAALDLQVWQYRTRPVWRVIRTGATMFIGTFDEQREGHRSPVYRLPERSHGTLHRAYLASIDALMDQAEQVI